MVVRNMYLLFPPFFQNHLTDLDDKSIIHYDNDNCHLDKEDCRTEVLYDTAKSFEGTQSCTEC